jgi:hypothetical protein
VWHIDYVSELNDLRLFGTTIRLFGKNPDNPYLLLFYIPYLISYAGVQFEIGYPYPSDSCKPKPDMVSLNQIQQQISTEIILYIYIPTYT